MRFAILWVGILLSGTLLVALSLASSARLQKTLWRRLWPVVTAALILAFWIFYLAFELGEVGVFFLPDWFPLYLESLAFAFAAAFAGLLWYGLRGSSLGEQKAKTWPRTGIIVIFVVVMAVNLTVLIYKTPGFKDEMARLSSETSGRLKAMLQRGTEAENSFKIYAKIEETFGRDQKPRWLSAIPAEASPAEISAYVTKNRDAIDLAYKASALPYCYDPGIDFAKPSFEWEIPHYQVFTSTGYLLYHSAVLKAAAGDAAGAFKDLAVIERISSQLTGNPDLISTMVGVRMATIYEQGMEAVLAALHSDKGIVTLPVKTRPADPDLIRRVLTFETLKNLQHLSTALWKSIPGIVEPYFMGEIDYLRHRLALLSKPAATYDEAYSMVVKFHEPAGGKNRGLIEGPGFKKYYVRCMSRDAHLALCDLAPAMTAYKSATGNYPGNLDALVPNYIDRVPADPFDGKPLKMKPVNGGVELYSPGPDARYEYNDKLTLNFFLGKGAYEEFRVKPAQQARLEKEKKEKERQEKEQSGAGN